MLRNSTGWRWTLLDKAPLLSREEYQEWLQSPATEWVLGRLQKQAEWELQRLQEELINSLPPLSPRQWAKALPSLSYRKGLYEAQALIAVALEYDKLLDEDEKEGK